MQCQCLLYGKTKNIPKRRLPLKKRDKNRMRNLYRQRLSRGGGGGGGGGSGGGGGGASLLDR